MSESIFRDKTDAIRTAEEKGLTCIFPRNNELTLDIDEGMDVRLNIIGVLAQNRILVLADLTTTSAGGNAHVYFRLDREFTPLQRIALQACLGSDPTREVLSIIRDDAQSNYPTAMFETTDEAIKVESWRAMLDSPPQPGIFDDDDIPF